MKTRSVRRPVDGAAAHGVEHQRRYVRFGVVDRIIFRQRPDIGIEIETGGATEFPVAEGSRIVARLVPVALLEADDAETGVGKPPGHRGAGGAGANDQYIGRTMCHAHRPQAFPSSSIPRFTNSQYTDSRIGTISWAPWIGRGLLKVQSSSMQFVAMRCRSSCLTPTSRNRRGRPSPAMKRSSTSAAGWPAAPSAALISAWRSALTCGVECQHGREHDARGVAVRHAGTAAQHMADGVARPHARAADDAGHRDPGADLAVEPRRCIGRIAFHRRQPATEQAQRLQRGAVGIGVAVDRAVGLDRMIDGADAGREPQPFRRVHGDGGIEDHREGDEAGMDVGLLQPQPRFGDAGPRVEFAAAQRRRHADLAHPRRAVLRETSFARDLVDHGAEGFEAVRLANVVLEADRDRLAAVGRRPAADTQQQVAAGIACLVGAGDHRVARAVRRHLVMQAGVARSERPGDPADRVGLAVERAPGEDEHPLGAQPIRRLGHGISGRAAKYHPFHSREDDLARPHGIRSYRLATLPRGSHGGPSVAGRDDVGDVQEEGAHHR